MYEKVHMANYRCNGTKFWYKCTFLGDAETCSSNFSFFIFRYFWRSIVNNLDTKMLSKFRTLTSPKIVKDQDVPHFLKLEEIELQYLKVKQKGEIRFYPLPPKEMK